MTPNESGQPTPETTERERMRLALRRVWGSPPTSWDEVVDAALAFNAERVARLESAHAEMVKNRDYWFGIAKENGVKAGKLEKERDEARGALAAANSEIAEFRLGLKDQRDLVDDYRDRRLRKSEKERDEARGAAVKANRRNAELVETARELLGILNDNSAVTWKFGPSSRTLKRYESAKALLARIDAENAAPVTVYTGSNGAVVGQSCAGFAVGAGGGGHLAPQCPPLWSWVCLPGSHSRKLKVMCYGQNDCWYDSYGARHGANEVWDIWEAEPRRPEVGDTIETREVIVNGLWIDSAKVWRVEEQRFHAQRATGKNKTFAFADHGKTWWFEDERPEGVRR